MGPIGLEVLRPSSVSNNGCTSSITLNNHVNVLHLKTKILSVSVFIYKIWLKIMTI